MDEKVKKYLLGLYQMLLSDMDIHPKELELFYKVMREKGIDENDIKNAQNEILLSSNSVLTPDSMDDNEKLGYLFDLSRMAWANGIIDDKEKAMLNDACKRLGYQEEYIPVIVEFLLEQAKQGKNIDDILTTIKNI